MTHSNLRKAIRTASGVQAVSNFRPTAAASIYYKYAGGGVVWDMSCGYGGRLLGALACGNVRKYIGTDPSEKTHKGLINIAHDFNHVGVAIEINKIGSEDFIPAEKVDLCFTSPPYFNTEEYAQESSQSFKKYPGKEDWKNGFLRETIRNCYKSLKDDGLLIINIANVKKYKDLEEDTVAVARQEGFDLRETLKLRLSSMMGGFKYEPIFVFTKGEEK